MAEKAGKMTFEEGMDSLAGIVLQLEGGSLDLDSALERFKEGVDMAVLLKKRLAKAEEQVAILTKKLDGEFETGEFMES